MKFYIHVLLAASFLIVSFPAHSYAESPSETYSSEVTTSTVGQFDVAAASMDEGPVASNPDAPTETAKRIGEDIVTGILMVLMCLGIIALAA